MCRMHTRRHEHESFGNTHTRLSNLLYSLPCRHTNKLQFARLPAIYTQKGVFMNGFFFRLIEESVWFTNENKSQLALHLYII